MESDSPCLNFIVLYELIKCKINNCVRSAAGQRFGPVIIPIVHIGACFHSGKLADRLCDDFTLMAVVPSPGVRVTVAESLIRDLGRIS